MENGNRSLVKKKNKALFVWTNNDEGMENKSLNVNSNQLNQDSYIDKKRSGSSDE